MSFDREDMRDYRDAQQKRRADRLPVRQLEIEKLSPDYLVKKITDYQFRINGELDLFPIHKRYHNIKTGKRGNYGTAIDIVKFQIKQKQ